MQIVITIEIPDGASVRTSAGGDRSAAAPAKPFTPRPDPEYPEWDPACHVHGVDWKLVPGGVSRKAVNEDGSPKRYNAFWACPERNCTEKPEWKPKDDVVDELGF